MRRRLATRLRGRAAGFVCAALVLLAATVLLDRLGGQSHLVNVALVYLLITLLASAVWGYAVGLSTAGLADLLVNFFFVPPVHTFTVQAPGNVLALLLFLAVAAVGASMLGLRRRQLALARRREAETAVLLALSHAVAEAPSAERALGALCALVASTLSAEGCAVVAVEDSELAVVASTPDPASRAPLTRDEASMAAEALRRRMVVSRATGTRRRGRFAVSVGGEGDRTLFVPFPERASPAGVLRVLGLGRQQPFDRPERLLFAIAAEASVSLHRALMTEQAGQAEVLRRADAFKSLLLSSVSHDLRSPLTAIKAAVENLRDGAVEWSAADREGFLESIEAETARLTATVNDLLQMSRLEQGAMDTRIEPVQLSLLLRDAAQAASHVVGGREVTTEADDALWGAADYGLLMRALGNLIENAARYSRSGAPIRLEARRSTGSRVRIDVIDAGPGIPAADLPRVFEKFYRGAQAGQSPGTGLGLSIAKAMVELCGGQLSAQAAEGGTDFAIELPASRPSGQPALEAS